MSISSPRLFALATALFFVFALGCSNEVPGQDVSFSHGRLNMKLAPEWVLVKDAGKKAYWRHGVSDDIKLSFEDQTQDYGTPMSVQAVRGAIGTELNMAHGGVDARLGLGGTAVLSYKKKVKEGSRKVYTQNWVVAAPYGYGAVARIAITLKVPDGQQGTPQFQQIVDLLDKQVGDAKIPPA